MKCKFNSGDKVFTTPKLIEEANKRCSYILDDTNQFKPHETYIVERTDDASRFIYIQGARNTFPTYMFKQVIENANNDQTSKNINIHSAFYDEI